MYLSPLLSPHSYLFFRINDWPHWSHSNGFFALCENMCIFNDHIFVYSLPHSSHRCLTPMCVSMCRSRWLFCLYRFGHIWHAYGFSPVCSRRCKIKYEARLNFLSQSGHWTVFPVCRVMCVFRIVFCVNDLSQNVHLYGRSPVCNRRWHVNAFACAKLRSHSGQTYGRSPVCVRWWLRSRNMVAKRLSAYVESDL